MAFVDEIKLHIKAGNGGSGVVRWRHERGKEFAGAAGGNAGKGGDVYAKAIRDLGILASYRNIKEFVSPNGGNGSRNSMHGKDGKDLVINFPIGSIITNLTTGKKVSLLKDEEKVLLLEGGRGGLGNEHFKSSTNVKPKQFTPGKEGEEADFLVELELVADIGFIGLPNAGKSSLLNELTNAKVKVASYAFTTLEPNLGDMYGFIIADIPGLIEGASEGKGLGHKFLKHIRRTKMLVHCLSLENENLEESYKTIRRELDAFDKDLGKKEEVVVLTKTDMVSKEILTKAKKKISKLNKRVFDVSILDDESIKKLKDDLIKILKAEK